ncbi:hypothetical protein [Parerythrobacter jejuensis]|uniref:Lipoprotein n=1 Tax=Parerythrobacter jejuensis TaxID=795812 RepID=A0A845AUL1_9SPHN|nr:hypothetical protein [Parerythrobacter jejuensis]MXP32873.1 hypothetical protein [Parerythrobacter jejuensis]
MKRLAMATLAIVAFACAPSDRAGPQAASAPFEKVGCREAETPVFQCTTAMGKQVAVCAAGPGDVHFRSGTEGVQVDVTGGRWASVPYSGGGEAQIQFRDGTKRYIVYSRMVRTNFTPGEPNNPAISDGLVIIDSEGTVGVDICDDAEDLLPVQYGAAKAAMRDEGKLFLD